MNGGAARFLAKARRLPSEAEVIASEGLSEAAGRSVVNRESRGRLRAAAFPFGQRVEVIHPPSPLGEHGVEPGPDVG